MKDKITDGEACDEWSALMYEYSKDELIDMIWGEMTSKKQKTELKNIKDLMRSEEE